MSVAIQPVSSATVQTSAQKIQVIVQLSESISKTFFNGSGVTAFRAISLAMAAVEKYAVGKNLSGAEKFRLATDAIPDIIEQLVRLGFIDAEKGANLKDTIEKMNVLRDDAINTLAFVTNNPGLIQADANDDDDNGKSCGCF